MSPIRPENRKRYPKGWKQISTKIKERAKWRCECEGECGHEHDENSGNRCSRKHNQMLRSERLDEFGMPVWFYVVLTVAHLDHQPENCEDDNLKAMCQRCHNAYDIPHRVATRQRRLQKEAGQMTLEMT